MFRNRAREVCDKTCDLLKEGQRITFSRDVFEEAYPCGWPSIYHSHIESFLSSKIGSAWGCWRVSEDSITKNCTVSRHKEGRERFYVDPDGRHLFQKDNNGYLKYKGGRP